MTAPTSSSTPTTGRRPPVGRAAQQGVVLIVALVMLVIIGLSSAAVMRNAMMADAVSNNTRMEALATEAAQIALRHCETRLLNGDSTLVVQPVAAAGQEPAWRSFANWHGDTATRLTNDDVVAEGAALSYDNADRRLPQCLVEQYPDPNSPGTQLANTFSVTARGFSPDYSEDNNGRRQSGSVVWLQSILRTN